MPNLERNADRCFYSKKTINPFNKLERKIGNGAVNINYERGTSKNT